MSRFFCILVISAMTITGGIANARDDLGDPMRPPNTGKRVASNSGSRVPDWDVSAILYSEGRRVAMINNHLVGVGSTVNGARVKAIYGNAVELDINGQRVTVKPSIRSVRREIQE